MSEVLEYQPQWVREDFVDFIAEKINPLWAWKKVKAQIVSTQALSTDFYQIQLRPNHNFKQDQLSAGQSVLVSVVIAGVSQQRSYSVVKVLNNGDLIIAVKRQGQVSNVLTALQDNDVVEISQGQGDFVLGRETAPILLIASGSGISAIYALLHAALAHNVENVALIYFSRDQAYDDELQALAQQHAHFQYYPIHTTVQKQHLDEALLKRLVPDFQQRTTYICGAQSMMNSVNALYRGFGIEHQLKQEYFQKLIDENLAAQPVVFLRSQQSFEATTNLLESAEQAGLRPSSGCRMGICNTCSCTKVSGSTKNLLTGEIEHGNQVQIKLCISQAISPVVINL
ncbi:ferredoxin-NADP reductase [Acinetobacter calcoaceticus]|uniref:Ferredoxin-NADP reductase n=1 Tax=Acinetobacter calcoaceticus TaxID=471 RepID=A0A4R1XLF9_ACICA|nr:ferredoxin-NADP reductase [Acinetobacter calcoaceticus]